MRALDRLCSRQGFHSPLLCDNMYAPEKAYSYSLEFCLGGFYNKWQLVFCPVLFFRPECACHLSLVCVLFCVISLVISKWQVPIKLPLVAGFKSESDTYFSVRNKCPLFYLPLPPIPLSHIVHLSQSQFW